MGVGHCLLPLLAGLVIAVSQKDDGNCFYSNFMVNASTKVGRGGEDGVSIVDFGYGFVPCRHWADSNEPYRLDLDSLSFLVSLSSSSSMASVNVEVLVGIDFPPYPTNVGHVEPKYQCCVEDKNDGCEPGHLIHPDNDDSLLYYTSFALEANRNVSLPDKNKILNLHGPHFWLLIAHCAEDDGDTVLNVDGNLSLHLQYGNLTQSMVQELQVMIALLVWYACLVIVGWRKLAGDRTPLQRQLLLIAVCGMLEMFFWTIAFIRWYYGERSKLFILFTAILGATKNSVARGVVLFLCLGKDIIANNWNDQSTSNHVPKLWIFTFSTIYFTIDIWSQTTRSARWDQYRSHQLSLCAANLIFFVAAFVASWRTKRAHGDVRNVSMTLRWIQLLLLAGFVLSTTAFVAYPTLALGGPPAPPFILSLISFVAILTGFCILLWSSLMNHSEGRSSGEYLPTTGEDYEDDQVELTGATST